jgi:hypothetical protein
MLTYADGCAVSDADAQANVREVFVARSETTGNLTYADVC